MLLSVDDQLMVFVSSYPIMPAFGLLYLHFIEEIMSSFLVGALLEAHQNRMEKKNSEVYIYMNPLEDDKKSGNASSWNKLTSSVVMAQAREG